MEGNVSEVTRVNREYNWEEVKPVVAIMELIAETKHEEGTGIATALDPPLQSYIATDALNTLAGNENTTSITLRISHYQIQIHENTVEVATIAED